MKGELFKIGKLSKMVKRRYCLMRDNTLFIYKDEKSEQADKLIYFPGMYISSDVNISGQYKSLKFHPF